MKDKKLMHMKRADLIEIIYQLQKSEEALKSEIADLKSQIENHRINIERSGSVAEAALRLSGIFEAAQTAADLYLEEIKARAEENGAEPCDQSTEEAPKPKSKRRSGRSSK